MRTGIVTLAAFRFLSNSRPLAPCKLISMIATWAPRCVIRSKPSRILSASPQTSRSGSLLISSASRSRNIGGSSTRTTLAFVASGCLVMLLRIPALLREGAGDQCPAPGRLSDGEVAADKTGAITHDVDAEPRGAVAGVGDAASVIGDTESGGISCPHEGEADHAGGAMATRVVDRFLRNSVEMGRAGGVANIYLPIGIKGALDVLQTGNG